MFITLCSSIVQYQLLNNFIYTPNCAIVLPLNVLFRFVYGFHKNVYIEIIEFRVCRWDWRKTPNTQTQSPHQQFVEIYQNHCRHEYIRQAHTHIHLMQSGKQQWYWPERTIHLVFTRPQWMRSARKFDWTKYWESGKYEKHRG